MILKDILNEMSPSEKDKHCMIPFSRNLIKIHFPISEACYLHDSFPLPANKFLLADFPVLTRMKTVRYIEFTKDV